MVGPPVAVLVGLNGQRDNFLLVFVKDSVKITIHTLGKMWILIALHFSVNQNPLFLPRNQPDFDEFI